MAVSEQDRQQAIEAFRAVATPEQATRVEQVHEQVSEVVARAQQIEVRTAEEATAATEFLSTLAGAKKRAEEARVFLTKPLNDHVKAINARVKAEVAPLEEADKILREKVLGYRRQVEEARIIEQERLDRERRDRERAAEEVRRAEEARARAEREAAAREAARAEEEAAQAERARREQLDRVTSETERRLTRETDDQLRLRLPADGDFDGLHDPLTARLAAQELQRRREAREAQERAAAAREREEQARRAEQEAAERPLPEIPRTVVAPAAPLASASGRAAERKRWIGTVVDESRVPREYLKVDQAAINAAVRNGARTIPGVKIEQVGELAIRAAS